MKKYEQPTMIAVDMMQMCSILAGTVRKTSGNADLTYGGGGTDAARVKESNLWDDEEW